MKTLLLSILLCLSPLLSTGCNTPTRTAYVTAGASVVTIETTFAAWGDYVVAGRATRAQDAKARELWGHYQRAKAVAIDVATSYSVSGDATRLEVALTAVASAAGDFVAFVGPLIH